MLETPTRVTRFTKTMTPTAYFDISLFGRAGRFTYPVPVMLRHQVKVGDIVQAQVDEDWSFPCRLVSLSEDSWIAQWERV